jgi:hypothetical protein
MIFVVVVMKLGLCGWFYVVVVVIFVVLILGLKDYGCEFVIVTLELLDYIL